MKNAQWERYWRVARFQKRMSR
ncbi:MOSC domain protein, partial [Vibrio parahaemolyticus 10296]